MFSQNFSCFFLISNFLKFSHNLPGNSQKILRNISYNFSKSSQSKQDEKFSNFLRNIFILSVNFFKHFVRFFQNTNTYRKLNASSAFLKVFWYFDRNLSKKFVDALKTLSTFSQHFPRIFKTFSRKFHQNFLLTFHYSLQIPKNVLKTFFKWQNIGCLIIISIITFLYTFYTLPL